MEDTAVVDTKRYIGCVVCSPSCPTQAITLVKKGTVDQYEAPENVFETYVTMAKEKGNI